MKAQIIHASSISRARLLLLVIVPALLPLGAIVAFAWLPAPLLKYFFFTKGWMAWTLTEYGIHRWAFHKKQPKVNRERDLFNHTFHHTHPADMIITPFMRSLAIVVFVLSIWSLFQGPVLLTYFTGWLSGMAIYSLMHYFLHQSVAAKVFPNLVKAHIWHHTKYANKCFGVCTTFWDRIFKTLPAEFGLLPERSIRFFYADAALTEPSVAKMLYLLNDNKIALKTGQDITAA